MGSRDIPPWGTMTWWRGRTVKRPASDRIAWARARRSYRPRHRLKITGRLDGLTITVQGSPEKLYAAARRSLADLATELRQRSRQRSLSRAAGAVQPCCKSHGPQRAGGDGVSLHRSAGAGAFRSPEPGVATRASGRSRTVASDATTQAFSRHATVTTASSRAVLGTSRCPKPSRDRARVIRATPHPHRTSIC
jgi:hypothetical protein